ncbi:putative receptor-like protein kinase At4g00960 isoform X2 [Setaria italica]|uniref:putative receptor-like protein kinase At4g00960 isoform X2 n=1 Tax=Setaria italica TaxID=4555 RepID=UPI000BE5082F|nr:putative receptor-like protein kinase At4g00960 isoform X2 [Setaria italica]
MADIAFRSLGKIIEAALKIKEAVETVKHNDRECREIERCVARVSALLERLEQTTETMKDPAMSGPLEDLAESVEKALELVSECQQQRHTFTVLRLWSASNMARELRQVQEDIVRKLQLGTFAHVTILLTINIQYAGARRSTPHPQDAGAGKVSHDGHSTGDASHPPPMRINCALACTSRPGAVRSEKDKPMVATVSSELLPDPLPAGATQFSLSQLKAATNDFSGDNVVGSGGFSVVYKGVLRNGLDVAIKKLLISDDFPERRVHHELNVGAKLQHKNIVKLLGYCFDNKEDERLYLLVQEYMPNGSLGRVINASRLDWPSCFKIIQGIAQGLHYLHEQHVLYMDLKPANILFDSKMNPVIIDFGLSIVLDDDDDEITCDSIAGTMGYIAPEKITGAKISMKSDVFSFGVILIEIITGRRVTPSCDLPALSSIEMIRAMKGLFDPAQVKDSQVMEINKCMKLGLMCTEWDPIDRPTMAEALELLE